MAIDVVENHSHLKRKDVPEVIEISSDSEPEYLPQKVRQRTRLIVRPPFIHVLEAKSGRTGIV